MTQLRPLSPRPEILVGSTDEARIEDPLRAQIGVRQSPVGRERVVFALALNKHGPRMLRRADVTHGDHLTVDPAGGVIGISGPVWVHRLLYAEVTADTRRLVR